VDLVVVSSVALSPTAPNSALSTLQTLGTPPPLPVAEGKEEAVSTPSAVQRRRSMMSQRPKLAISMQQLLARSLPAAE